MPQDPINNPFILADVRHRVSGALGVYASGVGQALFPVTLSGDYSFAAEPIPDRLWTARSVLGALFFVVPPLGAVALWLSALFSERRGRLETTRNRIAIAIALLWVPVAYFPHSNIPITLPTVRAERFWYVPVIGLSLAVGVFLSALVRRERLSTSPRWGTALVVFFLVFHATRARLHALDYSDDLVFWRSTSRAVPRSAKAHLNYGVMLGARSRLDERLTENRRAMELAPLWPMAHIYYADTLCRLDRTREAWPHYRDGFKLAPNDRNLLALALQCLWDHHAIDDHKEELLALADELPGTWLSFLARDIVSSGDKNGGVEKKYRPRGYNEGPGD